MRQGQTLTEYAFLLVLIVLAVILALTLFGGGLSNRSNNTVNQLPFR